jgi:hypothetical protein
MSGCNVILQVKQALTQICADPRNSVYVVSGDSQENLEDAMGDIPGLGLAASNGACFAHPVGFDSSSRKWETFDYGVDWKAVKKVGCCVCLLICRGGFSSAMDTNPSYFDRISPYGLFSLSLS